jgi:hypothetical protein
MVLLVKLVADGLAKLAAPTIPPGGCDTLEDRFRALADVANGPLAASPMS